jgi:hypothetical protein
MKWSVIGDRRTGDGKYKLDDCNPNCAADALSDMATGSDAQPAGPSLLARGHPLVLVYRVLQVPGRPAEVTQGDAVPLNPWIFPSAVAAAAPIYHLIALFPKQMHFTTTR